jgi:hypothetical protein
MALITANVGTFAHTATAAWVGGVVPAANVDDVLIPAGATITVATGTTFALGNPAAPTAYCLSVSGTLIIDGTVSVNGYIRHQANTGVVQVNGGGVLQSANTTTAVIYHNNKGTLRLRGTGIGAGRATVRNGAGAAGFSYTRDAGLNDSNTLDSEFGRFVGMAAVSWTSFFSGGVWRMIDTVVDACTLDTAGTSVSAFGAVEWRRVQQINSPNGTCCTLTGVATPDANVLRVLEDVAFDQQATIQGLYTYTRVIFGLQPGVALTSSTPLTDCVFGTTTQPPINMASSLLRGFRVVNNPAVSNWHGISYGGGDYTVDGLIFDGVCADGVGDMLILSGTPQALSLSVRNVLTTKSNAGGGTYGNLLTMAGNVNKSVAVAENCTVYSNTGESGLIGVGETYAGHPGMVSVVRNNNVASVAGTTAALLKRQNAGAAANVRDIVTPAGVTNNNVQRAIVGGAGVGTGNNTAAGGDGVMFTTLPAAPLDIDPQFVDDTRNLATWYRSVVGGTPGTRSADQDLALLAMASQHGDAPVVGATITAAWAWIGAGYVPLNTALRTNVSANNGGWIGARAGAAAAVSTAAMLRRRRR